MLLPRTYLEGDPPRPRGQAMAIIVGAMDRQRYYDATATIIKSWLAHVNVRTPIVRYYMDLDGPKDVRSTPKCSRMPARREGTANCK